MSHLLIVYNLLSLLCIRITIHKWSSQPKFSRFINEVIFLGRMNFSLIGKKVSLSAFIHICTTHTLWIDTEFVYQWFYIEMKQIICWYIKLALSYSMPLPLIKKKKSNLIKKSFDPPFPLSNYLSLCASNS